MLVIKILTHEIVCRCHSMDITGEVKIELDYIQSRIKSVNEKNRPRPWE